MMAILRACFFLSVSLFGSSLVSQRSVTYDVRDLGADIETSDRNPGTCLVTDVVLDQSMMRWAFHAYALIAVCDLRSVSCRLLKPDANSTYLVVVNPVVLADRINAIVTSEIGSTNGEMVDFDVPSKLEDEMELRTVDQYEIVEARIDWRHDPNEARTIRTGTHQCHRATPNKGVRRLTCWRCGTKSLVLGWRLFRCSNRTRNQWLRSLSMPSLLDSLRKG